MSKKRLTEAERLAHPCPKCGALPGARCLDYKGDVAALCMERGRPHITATKLQRKANERNERALASLGGDNTLLTFLHDGADNLLAAEGIKKVTAEDVAAEKVRDIRFGVESCGKAELSALQGLNWLILRHMRRTAAGLIGAEWEEKLWARCVRVYGSNYPYYVSTYSGALCTTGQIELAYEMRFDPARVKTTVFPRPPGGDRPPIEIKHDGRYLVVSEKWPPEEYVPVMSREDFTARFRLHHLSVEPAQDLSEPDDNGLFGRTIGMLQVTTARAA